MRCDQANCERQGEFRYVWPATGETKDICRACLPALVRLANAVGMQVKAERIAAINARMAVLKAAIPVTMFWRTSPFLRGSALIAMSHDACEHIEALAMAVEELLREEAASIVESRPPAADPDA